jgi:hypothetical protein
MTSKEHKFATVHKTKRLVFVCMTAGSQSHTWEEGINLNIKSDPFNKQDSENVILKYDNISTNSVTTQTADS